MINVKQNQFLALSFDSFPFNLDCSIKAIPCFLVKLNLKHTKLLPDFPRKSANCLLIIIFPHQGLEGFRFFNRFDFKCASDKNWYLRIILPLISGLPENKLVLGKSTKTPWEKRCVIFQLFAVCFVAESIFMVTCLKGLGGVSSDPPSASDRELQIWGIFSALWSGDMQRDARVC